MPTADYRFYAALWLLLFGLIAAAADPPWTPRVESRVSDLATVLSVADRERIVAMIARYEQETSHQIAVLIVPTLSGESIEAFSLRVAKASGIGRKGLDDGVLVTLAMKERAVRIELGSGMEKYVDGATAQSIIAESMIPAFRKQDYAGGLRAGLERLMTQGRLFVVPPPQRAAKQPPPQTAAIADIAAS